MSGVIVVMIIVVVMIIMVIIIVMVVAAVMVVMVMIVIMDMIIAVMMVVNMVMIVAFDMPVNTNDYPRPRNPAFHSRLNANFNPRYSRVIQPFQKINAGVIIKQFQQSGCHHIPRRAHAALNV
jgi:hypothetical protein